MSAPSRRFRIILLAVVVVLAVLGGGAFAAVRARPSPERVAQEQLRQQSVAGAQKTEGYKAAIGEGATFGDWHHGEVMMDLRGGHAWFDVPFQGPNGAGELHVEAERVEGVWRLDRLAVQRQGQTAMVELLAVPAPHDAPATPSHCH